MSMFFVFLIIPTWQDPAAFAGYAWFFGSGIFEAQCINPLGGGSGGLAPRRVRQKP